MDLSELLTIQAELNNHCDRCPTYEELEWAIMAELGEFAQSRKGEWCWWKRNGLIFTSEEKARQLDEAADILCFLLTGALMDKDVKPCDEWRDYFTFAKESTPQSLRSIAEFCYPGRYRLAIVSFTWMLGQLGFTQAEVELAYLHKVAINKARWESTPE